MRVKLNIRQKITIFILGASTLLFAITIGYFSITTKQIAYKNTTELTDTHTDHYAAIIESSLNSDLALFGRFRTLF